MMGGKIVTKKIIVALFVISVLFLGFTIGRYTNFIPTTKASWAAKSNQQFKKLDETEVALALAIAASSPQIAQEMIKYLKRGNVASDAMRNLQKMARQAVPASGQQARKKRPTLEEEMANVKEVKLADNAYSLGNANAPITVVLFTEFLCPYCGRVDPIIDKVAKEFGLDKVRVVFQNYIVHGERAAYWHRVAVAAGKQGKFWEMKKELFAIQRSLGRASQDTAFEEVITPIAKKLGLNLNKLKKDMQSEEVKKQIEEETALGRSLGVRGTPSAFINGRFFRGARDEAFYRQVIEKLLNQ